MSSYHFTTSAPSAQLVRDVQSLNSWPLGALESFSGVLVAFLGQRQQQEEEVLAQFAAAFPELADSARPTLTSLLHFFSASIRAAGSSPASSAHVRADLLQLGLGEDKADLLSSHFLASLESLSESAIAKTLQAAQLVDIGQTTDNNRDAIAGALCLPAVCPCVRAIAKRMSRLIQWHQMLSSCGRHGRCRATLCPTCFSLPSSCRAVLCVRPLFVSAWKFGVSAASSELEKMGACFLQLQMTLDRGNGNENVLMGQSRGEERSNHCVM